MPELVLVNMPFADRQRPSFALSQLAALVRRDLGDDFTVRVLYLNHDFVRFLGTETYDAITDDLAGHIAGIGDWFFRAVAFPEHEDNREEYFARYFAGPETARLRETVMRRRFVERPEDALLMAPESKRELYYVAEIPVSELQRLGLSASPDPTADAPGHALVPELNSTVYHQDKASKAKCKGIQKELAVIASRNIVHRPPAADSQAS